MRGRRPKPSALKKLQGNPGHRRLNEDEPALAPEIPECPDFVQGAGRREWRRMSALLANSNLLTAVDRTALAAYCTLYDRWLDAERQVRKGGTILLTKTGYPVLNPHVTLAQKTLAQLQKFLVEFGMTPSSRSRLRIEKPATEEDPLDAFLKRGSEIKPPAVQ
jgi:P27 family predicted phage terminase small subunit